MAENILEQISKTEKIPLSVIKKEITNGRCAVLKNLKRNINPVAIGNKFRCKVNINIGLSPESKDIKQEIDKLNLIIKYGADTVMDLTPSVYSNTTRKELIKNCSIPFGTVPIYTMIESQKDIKKINKTFILDSIERQCEEGVDFMTLHSAFRRTHLKYVKKRLMPVVSRGGALIARYMSITGNENPFYEYFPEIMDILAKYSVAVSIGDGLRPGCLADATDKAQLAELYEMRELLKICRKKGVYAMVEGPGHIPLNEIEKNVAIARKATSDAPLYFLGPLVIDSAMGFDHINGAIGSAMAGYYGVSLLCAVSPSEHIGLPNLKDIKSTLEVFELVKRAVNVAKGFKDFKIREKEMSLARKNFDWLKQFELSIDPNFTEERFHELNGKKSKHCSMCGSKYCAIKNSIKAMETV